MKRTLAVIVNPAAGGGRAERRYAAVHHRLEALGEVQLLRTEGPGHAIELARAAEATDIISVGGDGTLHEVVTGLMGREDRPRLGLLPLGTGNSFGRELDLTTMDQCLDAIAAGTTRAVDVVRAEHDDGVLYSINLFSVGFTAEAGELTNRRFKSLGAAGYILAVLITLARLKHPVFRVKLDDGPWDERRCALLSFSNSQYTGGDMRMAPAADPTDGRVDVIRVGALGRPRFLATFPKIFAGTHVHAPQIEATTARVVELDLEEPVDVMLDGEVVRVRPTRLEVLPGAVEVLA
jgi:YegS/Rv2252/BmrU family lipid kinase